jgi:acetylornithine/N-succinyldiaminopimelate aminotransferase
MSAELKPYHPPADGLAPVFAQYPLEVVSAEGVWLTTRDGRKVLDLYGGHAVAALGYRHAGWMQALARQSAEVSFQTNAIPMDVRARAAQRLLRFANLPLDSVFFVNSGAEANENALKMAFKMRPGRTHVAATEMSFHGRVRRSTFPSCRVPTLPAPSNTSRTTLRP